MAHIPQSVCAAVTLEGCDTLLERELLLRSAWQPPMRTSAPSPRAPKCRKVGLPTKGIYPVLTHRLGGSQ